VLTEYKEQFVVDLDRLVNLLMEFAAALDVMRRKPDTQPGILQAFMQPAAEGVIDTAVANEAGVKLEGLVEEGGQVVDQYVWEPATPEKGQGERSRFREGTMVEDAGTFVDAGL